jgi:hypothetical protein
MPRAGFEPTIPVTNQPRPLGRAATGTEKRDPYAYIYMYIYIYIYVYIYMYIYIPTHKLLEHRTLKP